MPTGALQINGLKRLNFFGLSKLYRCRFELSLFKGGFTWRRPAPAICRPVSALLFCSTAREGAQKELGGGGNFG